MTSCDQDTHTQLPEPEQRIELRSGATVSTNGVSSPRFIFNDELSFEGFIQQLNTYNIDSFLTTLTPYNYQSFYNRTGVHLDSVDTFDEPVLEAILNAYGVVEIDGYLIKMHPTWDRIYVLPNTASPADQQAFERAASDVDVSALPIPTATMPLDCDFFGVLDANNGVIPPNLDCSSQASSGKRCSINRAIKAEVIYGCERGYRASLEIRYRSFGFLKRLRVIFQHVELGNAPLGITTPAPVDFDREVTAEWLRRNSSNLNLFNEDFNGFEPGSLFNDGDESLYTGTRCLTSGSVTASMRFRDRCDGRIRQLGPITLTF